MTIYKSIFKKKVSPVNIIGKIIEVTFSSNPYLIGLKGRVVKETKNTIIIETTGSKRKIIPKAACRFKIYNTEGDRSYEINGKSLVGTLDRRLKSWVGR